jgi:hypothetical protein
VLSREAFLQQLGLDNAKMQQGDRRNMVRSLNIRS